jgi:hypothetical protein
MAVKMISEVTIMVSINLIQQTDKLKQALEKAVASGSRQTFHSAISSIDWTAASPDQFILAIDLALELGDMTLATKYTVN